jgi:hypothetical protein
MKNRRILLLGFYHRRYIEPLIKWSRVLSKKGWTVNQMYPNCFYKEDVLLEITKGYDVILYFGHGSPGTWCGFKSINVDDLLSIKSTNTNTIIIMLSCYGLDKSHGKSLGDVIIKNSLAKYVFGYKSAVKYTENIVVLNKILTVLCTVNYSTSKSKIVSLIRVSDPRCCKGQIIEINNLEIQYIKKRLSPH